MVIIISFYFVDSKEVLRSISNINWFWFSLSMLLTIITSLLGSLRLKIILNLITNISLFFVWAIGHIAGLISFVLPFSAGGLAMVGFISKKSKVSYEKTFFALFLNNMVVYVFGTLLGILGVIFFMRKKLLAVNYDLDYNFLLLTTIFFILLLIIIFAVSKFRIKSINVLLLKFKQNIGFFIKSKIVLLKVIVLTVLITFTQIIQLYFLYNAFGMYPPLIDLFLATNLIILMGIIPLGIIKYGQFEIVGILTLPYLLNLDKNKIFTLLLTAHMASLIIMLIGSMLSLYYLKLDLSLIKRLSKLEKEY